MDVRPAPASSRSATAAVLGVLAIPVGLVSAMALLAGGAAPSPSADLAVALPATLVGVAAGLVVARLGSAIVHGLAAISSALVAWDRRRSVRWRPGGPGLVGAVPVLVAVPSRRSRPILRRGPPVV